MEKTKSANPDNIIRQLNLPDNGVGGQTQKIKRQVIEELQGLSKSEKIKRLKEMFPTDPVWEKLGVV